MTEHGSASAISKMEPPATSGLCASNQNGVSEMADQEVPTPSIRQTGDEATVDKPNCEAPDEPPGDQSLRDQTPGAQTSSDQLIGDQPLSDQPPGDPPTDDEPPVIIDSEKLIAEVRKSSRIYRNDFLAYFEKLYTETQWEIICENLFPDWHTFSPRKMKETVIKVQKNWAEVREPIFDKSIERAGGIRKQVTEDKFKESASFRGGTEKSAAFTEEKTPRDLSCLTSCKVSNIKDPIPINLKLKRKRQDTFKETQQENKRYKQPNQQETPQKVLQHDSTAMPSTSASQNYKAPFPNVEPGTSSSQTKQPGNIADNPNLRTFPGTLKMSEKITYPRGVTDYMDFIELTQRQPSTSSYVPPETGLYKNPDIAYTLYALLSHLNYEQQAVIWPKIADLIFDAQKPKKIRILQNELLTDRPSTSFVAATGPEIVPFSGTETLVGPRLVGQETLVGTGLVEQETLAGLVVTQETLAASELTFQEALPTSELTGQETVEPEFEETEEELIYASSYGRPTNAQGEIIYPETDHEDLDEE